MFSLATIHPALHFAQPIYYIHELFKFTAFAEITVLLYEKENSDKKLVKMS